MLVACGKYLTSSFFAIQVSCLITNKTIPKPALSLLLYKTLNSELIFLNIIWVESIRYKLWQWTMVSVIAQVHENTESESCQKLLIFCSSFTAQTINRYKHCYKLRVMRMLQQIFKSSKTNKRDLVHILPHFPYLCSGLPLLVFEELSFTLLVVNKNILFRYIMAMYLRFT